MIAAHEIEVASSNCNWEFPDKKPSKMASCRPIPECSPSDLPIIEHAELICGGIIIIRAVAVLVTQLHYLFAIECAVHCNVQCVLPFFCTIPFVYYWIAWKRTMLSEKNRKMFFWQYLGKSYERFTQNFFWRKKRTKNIFLLFGSILEAKRTH